MKIAILLDGSQENIFYAGQTVSGNVRVETNDEIKMRGIRLEVFGESRVQWTEDNGKQRTTFMGVEPFIDYKMYLTGSDEDSEITLKAGIHTFPLSFVLPSTIPSSFKAIFGYIGYRVKAVVNRIRRLDDSTEILINVIHTINLNNEPPQVKGPIVVQEENPMVGCCVTLCCIRGLPEIELRVNRGCFVPGEKMILNGKVVNKSNTEVKRTVINFIQEIEFLVMNEAGQIFGRKYLHKILDSTKRSRLESGSTDTFTNVAITVPPVTEFRLDGSNLINIKYFIQVKVDFARSCCAESGIRQDIVIGHIPLQGDFQFGEPITTQPPMYASLFPSGGVHNAGFDTAGVKTWNDDGRDLTEFQAI